MSALAEGKKRERSASNPVDPLTVVFKNIPWDATVDDVRTWLASVAIDAADVTVPTRAKNPKLNTGVAVVLAHDEAAAAALCAREDLVMRDRRLRVFWGNRPKAPKTKEPKTTTRPPTSTVALADGALRLAAGGREVALACGAADASVVDASKDEIRDLQLFATPAKIRVCRSLGEMDAGVRALRASLRAGHGACASAGGDEAVDVLGFDTETKPTFRKGEAQRTVALVQLATRDVVVLFLLYKLPGGGLPAALRDVLADARVLKVGVGCSGDERSLRKRDPAFDARASFVDLEKLARARFPSLRACGLRGLVGSLGRRRLSKGQQCANWEHPTYSRAMIQYAANDAAAGLFALDAILAARAAPPPEASTAP